MSTQSLADRECVPCKGGTPPLKHERIEELEAQLPGWTVVEDHHLLRKYKRKDFGDALALVNAIGEVAERAGHHPELRFSWGWVEVKVWTHKIDGLTESDFILAAKCDRVAGA